jgi:asparagine synthase (glutamine-hydrolysing)
MPGIVGLITKKPRQQAEQELGRMLDAIRHEAFYTTGTWVDESLGVYLGWAVRKNSFSDGMPFRNEKGDVVLVFSGEEYPVPGTASRLKERGHAIDEHDASYLVHVYEEDPAFPVGLNGMFHGLVADRTRGTTTLFNDRYGMHRIYYHESKEAFYFAAEAKAILAARTELRRADPRSLGEFVACGCVLENRSLFESIYVLPGGASWVFRNGSLEHKNTYFEPREWEEQESLDPESYYQGVREALSQNLPRYFNGQNRIGIALTGGLDTRIIMAWRKPAPESLPCYTFGGAYRECHDVRIARKVAEICGQRHQVIPVGSDFLSRFPHYAERSLYLTEGCVDLSRATDLYVSEKAREIAPVKVVGTYGSEILRQVPMFKAVEPKPGLFRPDLLPYVCQAGATYHELRREHPVTFAAFRQSPWYHHGVLALEQTQLTVRSPYLDNDFVRAVFRAPKSILGTSDIRLRLIGDGSPALARIPTDRGLGGDGWRLSSDAYRAYLEFTFKAEYAYDYGMPQWVARTDHVLSLFHLERLFLGRHKLIHYRVWYRDALSEYVRQMLLDPRTLSRPYLERAGLEAIVQGHLKGNRNYTNEIHKVLTLELLHRLFLDPQ